MSPGAFADILAAAQAGDEEAFAALWRTLNPAVLRYSRVVVGSAAEDVTSETWMTVARHLPRFSGPEPAFRAWVFTIARHRALDWRRQLTRRPAETVPTASLADRASSDDPSERALEHLATEAAISLVARLPTEQAEVVMLRAVAGLDVAAVARIVDKPPGTVRVLAHRGLRRLAELVDPEFAEDQM